MGASSSKTVSRSRLSSAAPQVFSIPELLECILIQLPWYDLFVLQSVNKTFQQVITESIAVKELMTRRLGDSTRWPGTTPISPLLKDQISWGPYQKPSWQIAWDNLLFDFKYEIPSPDIPDSAHTCHAMGIIPSRAGKPALVHGSWKLTRLTNVSGMVLIKINVRALALMDDCHLSCGLYQDRITLNAAETTLGDVSEILYEVHCRSSEEHTQLERATRTGAKLRDVVRARCLRADSRVRCRACTSWEGQRWDNATGKYV